MYVYFRKIPQCSFGGYAAKTYLQSALPRSNGQGDRPEIKWRSDDATGIDWMPYVGIRARVCTAAATTAGFATRVDARAARDESAGRRFPDARAGDDGMALGEMAPSRLVINQCASSARVRLSTY